MQSPAANCLSPRQARTLAQHELLVIVACSTDQARQVVNPLQDTAGNGSKGEGSAAEAAGAAPQRMGHHMTAFSCFCD